MNGIGGITRFDLENQNLLKQILKELKRLNDNLEGKNLSSNNSED